MEAIRLLELDIDVIHATTGRRVWCPPISRSNTGTCLVTRSIATLFTIHNIAYQGVFWHWDMLLTGLDWKYFNWHQMEYYGKLNLLKTGVVFADAIGTVSPRYAQEIQTPDFGRGLEGVLQHRRESLFGILNGIDESVWNPATDPNLAARYTAETAAQGKAACKASLQRELGLSEQASEPLIGMIGRMDDQKGFDLVADVIGEWVQAERGPMGHSGQRRAQVSPSVRRVAQSLPTKGRRATGILRSTSPPDRGGGGHVPDAQPFRTLWVESDVQPEYGTVPVVRETGGLADTITDASEVAVAAGKANGFSFREDNALALSETLARACDTYRRRPDVWHRLIEAGMRQDWSWRHSANEYVRVYKQIKERK